MEQEIIEEIHAKSAPIDKNNIVYTTKFASKDWAIDLEHPEKNTIKCCKRAVFKRAQTSKQP